MNRQIKILHIITRLDKGGSAENTILSCIGLVKLGYKVDLLFGRTEEPNINLLKEAREAGVEFIEEEDLVRNVNPIKDISAFFDIVKFIRSGKYDIVHTHSSKAGIIGRLAAKIGGAKKVIYTPHGHVFYGYFGEFITRAIILLEAIMARFTDKIIGLTPAECEEWYGYGIGRQAQYVSIPSGIDFDELNKEAISERGLRTELNIPENAVVVGAMGRFVGIKGFHFYIEAAIEQLKKRDNVYFVLAGDGPLWSSYKDMLKKAGSPERFRMIGWQEKMVDVLDDIDIFVLPSLNEGMGRVLVEAMYFEKPVIAADVGGVPSVVGWDSGILVAPQSSRDIYDALDVLIDCPGCRVSMGKRGREKAVADYSYDTMIKGLDSLYKELM